MKRSEIINQYRNVIAESIISHYRTVLECNGKIQYQIYIWEDGEIECMEQPQGANNEWLESRTDRKLYYVCKVGGTYFCPWDCTDERKPDDEEQCKQMEQEIIDWCMEEYQDNVGTEIDAIIEYAKQMEKADEEYSKFWEKA